MLVLGCGSSTASKPDHPDSARFNIIEVQHGEVTSVTPHEWRSALNRFERLPDELVAAARQRALSL